MKQFINIYKKEIKEIYEKGDFTEYSFRKDFQEFLENIFKEQEYEIELIHEPSRKEEGSPDFRIIKNYSLIGYIETKTPDKDITKLSTEEKNQVKKYVKASENVILTNYKDFILYQNNKRNKIIHLLDESFSIFDEKGFETLIYKFLSKSSPSIKTPEKLAEFLAKYTRILKDSILSSMDKNNNQYMKAYYNLFKKYLLSTIKKEEFADAIAQTITYGLFMAKLNLNTEIKRESILLKGIPKHLKLISRIFYYIIGADLPKELEWIIDDIINILNNSDWETIVSNFRIRNGEKDPFIHFYEPFLAKYNPKLRKSRGVYYTPPEVVDFIINSVDKILEKKFNTDLTDYKKVLILDPAIGTGTFLGTAIQKIYEKVGKDIFPDYVKDHIIKNFYGFEILISPYIISHLKLIRIIKELGGKLPEDKRLKIYLTNTLNLMRELTQARLPLEQIMQKECEQADDIKKKTDIFVILGNPPYETKVQNVFIEDLVKKDYLNGLGVEKEQKKGVIQDDYVKFIKFAQWKIENHSKKGIIAYITNNSYLDGLIHRRMRESLLQSFDEIYILNLHGNKRRGEPDENVFDIQQGVAISLFIKFTEGRHNPENCNIYYYSTLEKNLLKREEKNDFLQKNDITTTIS